MSSGRRARSADCCVRKDAAWLSTVYRLLASVRAAMPAARKVRFEGVASEFAEFDFGEVSVRLEDGTWRTGHFAGYRLRYSRWIHVGLVPNERVEAVIRSLLANFAASGASHSAWRSIIPRRSSSSTRKAGRCGIRCWRLWRSITANGLHTCESAPADTLRTQGLRDWRMYQLLARPPTSPART